MDASAWDERYAATELVWSAGPNQFVENELTDLPPGRALDLACGEGRNARWLAERGWEVTAMDFSPVAVEKGRSLHADIDWQVGDARTAQLPQDLDLVLIAYLQIRPEERTPVMRRAFEALRPGGRFLVVGHDSTNIAEGTGGPQDPAVLYTGEAGLTDLPGVELQVVRAGRVARMVASDEGTARAWDALVHVIRS
ncbi:MAG: class I SAM-dependent methyltransferase [Marmoricola sp.]